MFVKLKGPVISNKVCTIDVWSADDLIFLPSFPKFLNCFHFERSNPSGHDELQTCPLN